MRNGSDCKGLRNICIMPGFKVDKILHGHQVQVPKATRNYETRIFVTQRFRPKKYKTEIVIFPTVNRYSAELNDLRFYASCVYFKKGLAKGDMILDQSYFVQGETKRKFHQTMKLQPNTEIPLLNMGRSKSEPSRRNITM